jgi:hypothetical protein
MEAFARMFLALADPDPPDSAALAQAVSSLATYLEAENKELAVSAALWQAEALRKLERPDRAVELLSLPLSPPGTSPLEFFARLERIQALADAGDLEAAMVLALRMEEACHRWYQDQQRQAEARRACLWLRVRLYEQYVKDVERKPDEYVMRWNKLLDRVRKALWPDSGPAEVPRLGWTMPLLLDPLEALEAACRPASKADQPGDEAVSQSVEVSSDSEEQVPASAPAEQPSPHR